MEIVNSVVLFLSGALLIYAGSMRLIKPLKSLCLKAYLENPKLRIEAKADIYNEMRGAGSSIALTGVAILLGIFFQQLLVASFVVAIVTFLGYAFGRLVGIKLDGKPNEAVMQGLFSELILGGANLFCLVNILM